MWKFERLLMFCYVLHKTTVPLWMEIHVYRTMKLMPTTTGPSTCNPSLHAQTVLRVAVSAINPPTW